MLVKFTSDAYADIVMFGEVANFFIKAMGYSGNIPGAITAENIPIALDNLNKALINVVEDSQQDEENEDYVSLHTRAIPLIEMLEASIEREADILWDSE